MPRYTANTAGSVAVSPKDPDSVIEYVFDWQPLTNGTDPQGTDWLGTDETISSHTIVVTNGLVADSSDRTGIVVRIGATDYTLANNTAVRVWLSGGTLGKVAQVTCRVTSSGGRTEDKSISIPIAHK